MENEVLFALLLTVFAGLSTGVGSVIALFAKRKNTKFLACSLGFSAGVMIYVSMIEIFGKAKTYLSNGLGDIGGTAFTVIFFFAGIVLIGLIDFFVPSAEGDIGANKKENGGKMLERMGFMTGVAIGIHNFPEGLATFTSALKDPHLGVAIAVAIAIHNIPEGIATSAPIYFSTGSRWKAFYVSFLSGMTEPVGAIIGYMVLRPFFNDFVFGALFASVAGIMVYLSFDTLLPLAREYGENHHVIIGIMSGMIIMALGLIFL